MATAHSILERMRARARQVILLAQPCTRTLADDRPQTTDEKREESDWLRTVRGIRQVASMQAKGGMA